MDSKAQFTCNIVSLEQQLFSGEVIAARVPAALGQMSIYRGHCALLSAIPAGTVELQVTAQTEQFFFVSGGYLEVQADSVTILADTALRAEDIDQQQAEMARDRARQALAEGSVDIDYLQVLKQLNQSLARLRTLQELRRR